ncbi:MAG: type IV pilus modification protein PilV [Methylococcales bacterium]|nr:type IV pilus modification protein PilV [Methylococcales bacterium]
MKRHDGFTLIEVLIATVVLSVGLLGLAALQASSLKNNQSAYNRSQAMELAGDMADKMRANISYAKSAGNFYISKTPTSAAAVPDCLIPPDGCSPAQMAENDLFEWNEAVTTSLPATFGDTPEPMCTISLNGNVFTITIKWTEDRFSVATDHVETGISTFAMSFQL